jgi:signal transduction histidine kinase
MQDLKLSDEQLLQELERRFIQNKSSVIQLQKLTSQLKELNKKLEESEAMKTHFISNITNEIINPFAAIIGLSRSILDVKKENWDKVISMVQLIHSEAFTLDFQLRNIFSAAKLEAGEWEPEIMHMGVLQTIQSTIDSFKYEIEKKKLQVLIEDGQGNELQSDLLFASDAEKIRIILSNLLSNAIKFSYNESKIIVKTWLESDQLYISVTDYGMGVSEENKKIIFDRFSRLDSGINSVNRGHGLGLSVNKALIDLLGGEITMDSIPGQKTVFTVSLPQNEITGEGFATDGNEFLFDDPTDQQVF